MGSPIGLVGILALVLIGVALSEHRRGINWRLVGTGIVLQGVIALMLLRVPGVVDAFDLLAVGVTKVISFADKGTEFLFGKLADASMPWGFVFAVKVLPTIIFFSALMAVLYHLRVMQVIVAGVAWALRRTLGITGAEALSAAANIFVGQTEAPLTVRPYIAGMTRSQLAAVMAVGFSTIAGSVMAAYVNMLGGDSEASRVLFAKHIITASFMAAPAGLVMAKILVPERESPREESLNALLHEEKTTSNVLDAAASGATDGMKLALNVAAMLAAFVALLALLNWPLEALSMQSGVAAWREANGVPVLNLQAILGYVLYPLARSDFGYHNFKRTIIRVIEHWRVRHFMFHF